MKNVISLDQVLQNVKAQNEASRLTIEAAEKTIKIINKIVESREALGLTQRELAKKCGIQQPALARIETCKVIPKLNTIIKIAEAVGVKIESFTPIEEKQMKMIYSFSQVIISSSLYNSNIGGYYGYKNQ